MAKAFSLRIVLLIFAITMLSACVNNSEYICNSSCTDTDIRTNVQVKIAAESCLNNQNIRVVSYERIVTLDGSVENPTQRNIAGNLAKSVPGVLAVKNRLKIKDQYNRPV